MKSWFQRHNNVAEKRRRPIKIGDTVFKSLADAALHCNKSIATLRTMAKEGRCLPNGDKVELIDKKQE